MEERSKAIIATGYLLRLGMVALFGLGLAGWCIYDGTVTYPHQRERALKFQELTDEGLTEADFVAKWEAVATENGWPLTNPGKAKTKYDFMNQYIMAGMVGPVGLIFLFFLVRSRGRWIEASETGLNTSWGPQCDYDDIVTLDKKKWHNKGIAVVNFEKDGGKKKLVLDDCKYDRYATEFILRKVESEIEPDQIVNGPAEPEPGSEATEESSDAEAAFDGTVEGAAEGAAEGSENQPLS